MSQNYEYTGTVEQVGETQSFGTNGFTKRQVCLCDANDNGYPERAVFTFKKSHTADLDAVHTGDKVKIRFSVESRESNGRYFTDLVAFRIEVTAAAAKPAPSVKKYEANGKSARQAYLDNGGEISEFGLFCTRVTGKSSSKDYDVGDWLAVIAEACRPKTESAIPPDVGDDDDLPF